MHSNALPPHPPAAGRIHRLAESVVNRIAAGEVIQRPANALKELLENSLDAKASSISVVVNHGGLKLLQITDNGTGIRKEDLSIVCERFTTSKLQTFDDLSSIATYGFRGEALASISHVARLTIVTKTAEERCGFRTSYSDGLPITEPVPCAANQGTQISVEDLFFNVPTRQRALKSGSDEFNRVADVVSKYAIHNAGVSFSLKRQSDQAVVVRTQKEASVVENIGVIFGAAIAKELVEVEKRDDKYRFRVVGRISNVNFSTKKFNFLLFINHRLVECSALKKAVEMVYGAYLPKGGCPFVYMSLEIDPRNVDVNVHPTKHEVHFLHQDDIIESIQQCVDAKLLGSNASRTFYTQAALPGARKESLDKVLLEKDPAAKVVAEKDMVRTDAKEQKIDRFITVGRPSASREAAALAQVQVVEEEEGEEEEGVTKFRTQEVETVRAADVNQPDEDMDTVEMALDGKADIENVDSSSSRREIKLDSIKNLRQAVQDRAHPGLRDLICNHSFVGCVDRQLALLQHGTKLYLADTARLSEEMFYQIMLRDFGNFGTIRLDPAPSVKRLALIALESDKSEWTEADGDKESLALKVLDCLQKRADMLDDYFSMEIDEDGNLLSLPRLVENYAPRLIDLPEFVLRLATEVNWNEEEACFDTFSREVAKLYAIRDKEGSRYDDDQHDENSTHDVNSVEDMWKQTVEQLVFGPSKKFLLPPKSFTNNLTFIQIANLPDLYKVFERC